MTVIARHPDLHGLYHVAGPPISKCELLRLLSGAFRADVEVEPTAEPRLDRSLDARRFWDEVGLSPPEWPAMVAEMAADAAPYDLWRSS